MMEEILLSGLPLVGCHTSSTYCPRMKQHGWLRWSSTYVILIASAMKRHKMINVWDRDVLAASVYLINGKLVVAELGISPAFQAFHSRDHFSSGCWRRRSRLAEENQSGLITIFRVSCSDQDRQFATTLDIPFSKKPDRPTSSGHKRWSRVSSARGSKSRSGKFLNLMNGMVIPCGHLIRDGAPDVETRTPRCCRSQ